jgi:hypothetical protein
MAETKTKRLEDVLRFRVRQFLKAQKWGIELQNTLERFETEQCHAYIVGGFLRELMLCGPAARPRDIDIVFAGTSAEKVEFFFWNNKEGRVRNRFGGLRFNFGGCPFDVWSLEDTWAFRNKRIYQAEISTFPQTTFLNVDAIAFKLKNDCEDEIFSNGFFEGISTRTLEINLEENPFPETCVVRSLMMAWMLDFAIGPKLAGYLSRHSKSSSLKELQRIQSLHYGFVAMDGEDLRSCFDAINAQLSRSKTSAVYLPGRQLKFERSEPEMGKVSRSAFGVWLAKIAENVFVHSRPIRQLQKRFSGSQRPTINVLNVRPRWLKRV